MKRIEEQTCRRVSRDALCVDAEKRQRTAAVQDASRELGGEEPPPGFGLRQPSAAFPRPALPIASNHILVGMAALVILSGCAVGPNYKPPQTSVGASFAYAPTNAATADEAALATWWKGFNDARLDDLVDRAIAHNQDLRIATANLKEARALLRLTTFVLAPTGAGVTRAK